MELIPIIVEFGIDSTLIERLEYYEETGDLDIFFKKYYIDQVTYQKVTQEFFTAFVEARSKGKFYLQYIKPYFISKKTETMSRRVIKCKIDVTKINKNFLYTGEKGTYLNFTVLFAEEADAYGNNGMLIQDVPTDIYKKESAAKMDKSKMTKGEILGNCKEFSASTTSDESKPGVESGTRGGALDDDLPF